MINYIDDNLRDIFYYRFNIYVINWFQIDKNKVCVEAGMKLLRVKTCS